jgi:hypothetical protein
MSKLTPRPVTYLSLLIILGFAVQISGCASDSYAAEGAAKGAGTGALAGAVGGMATALIFGGNVGEAAARGAVYGGASGAVVGGMSGASVDKQVAAQEQAERDKNIAKFRDEIGADAYNGFVALAECKHDIAIANAREARKSRNRDYSLAGLWIEVLTEADRQNPDAASELFPELVSSDKAIKTDGDAQLRTDEALQQLGEIRVEYDLPKDCAS